MPVPSPVQRRPRALLRICTLLAALGALLFAFAPSAMADQVIAQTFSNGNRFYGGCVSERFPSHETFVPTASGRVSGLTVMLDSETHGHVNLRVAIYTAGLGQYLGSGTTGFETYGGLYYRETINAYVPFDNGPQLNAGQTYELYVVASAQYDYRCGLFADAAGVTNGEQMQQVNGNVWPGFPYTVYASTQVPPSCAGDRATAAFNASTTVAPGCSGSHLRYSLTGQPGHGTVSGPSADGTYSYTPNHDYAGADSFTLTATDDQGQTATDTVSVTVNKPTPPSCSGDAGPVDFNTPGAQTFSCSGTELSYSVASAPGHGSLDAISGNRVLYHPNGGFTGTDSYSVTATDPTGQTATDLVTVTVGSPQGVKENVSDQLSANTAEAGFSLPAGATRTVSVSCPSGQVATDGHPWVQAVDQGTGTPADVQVLEERATAPGTYAFTLLNGLAGQAQGQLYVACVSTSTSLGDSLSLSAPVTRSVAVGPGQTGTTLSCPDGTTAVAPGYVQQNAAGAAPAIVSLAESRPVNGGSDWRFAFDANAPGQVTVSVSCLGYATGAGALVNEVASTRTASVSGSGSPESTTQSCPVNTVAAVAGYSLPSDVTFTGEEPQARTDLMWLEGRAGGGTATLSLLCLGLTTSSTSSPVTAAGVASPTVQVAPNGQAVTAMLRLPARAIVAIRGVAHGTTVLTARRTLAAGREQIALHLDGRGRRELARVGTLRVRLLFAIRSRGHAHRFIRTVTLHRS